MADALFMGGVMNFTDPLLGWQLYIWGWIFIGILCIVAWLGWRYGQWEPYKPVWGLFYAFKAGSQAAFIFNLGLICDLFSERDAKCIFDYSKWKYKGLNKIQKWFFNYATVFLNSDELPPAKALLYKLGGVNRDVEIAKKMQNYEWEAHSSVTVGGTHTDMILDADRWTVKGSNQHKQIETQCEQHNDANQDDQIHAYPKYMRYLIDGKLQCPDGVTPFITVPWTRIDAAFPINVGNVMSSGAKRQYARELEEQDNNSLSKYYLPVLVGGLGLSALILVVRMVTHFFH